MKLLAPLGRILFSMIFIASSIGHFGSKLVGYAAQHGVPAPHVLVPLAGVLALVGGLSVLFGFYARAGAWLLVAFLIPVTIAMHNFWAIADPAAAQLQQINFMKNMALLGGAFLITWFGARPVSVDAWLESRAAYKSSQGVPSRSPV
jgi:putative oxidoreductase